MRWRLAACASFVLVGSLLGCGGDRDEADVYRAEREMYRAEWTRRSLSIRPKDVKDAQWAALADTYERIGYRYGLRPSGGTHGLARLQLRTLGAAALFAAAQIHEGIGDSARVDGIYREMASKFSDIPSLRAEVALAQGVLAERSRDYDRAIELYRNVIEGVEPDTSGAGAPSVVLTLPVRVARLYVLQRNEAAARQAYDIAARYYERVSESHRGTVIEIDADEFLAEVAAEKGEWDRADAILRDLERRLAGSPKPPRDPADVAFARSGVLLKSGASPEAIHSALEAVVDGYPKSGVAPRALLALAANADQRDRPEEAFEYLDRIGEEYPKDEEFLSQALIYRARLLDARGRWPEALETYRTLTSQHPLSEAALTAPLEIAQREARAGDEAAARTALDAARRAYLDFIDRYPPSRYTILARTNLARTLALLKDYESAVTEMVRLGEDLAGTTEGAAWFASAAKMARDELADRERAAEILDRMAKAHEGADPGKWATREAQKLREPPTP